MPLTAMLLVGLAVGLFARLVVPGRQPGGLFMTLLLGIAGSFVAGYAGRGMGFYDLPGRGVGLLASVAGAVLLLWVYRVVRKR